MIGPGLAGLGLPRPDLQQPHISVLTINIVLSAEPGPGHPPTIDIVMVITMLMREINISIPKVAVL